MIFNYDPAERADELKEKGYVILKDVLTQDFVQYLQSFAEEAQNEGDREKADWKITGKKRQFVFEFPEPAAAEAFRDAMARLTGIPAADFSISERHLKVYEPSAEPWPAPHKDRGASQYSIGLPVSLSEGSSVCIFPELDRTPNTGERAVFLTDRDRPDLADIYRNEEVVMLNEAIGDVVVFYGSALFHERIRPANSSILYIKVNGTGEDPLGENIFADAAAY
jgi:hypothetical protein